MRWVGEGDLNRGSGNSPEISAILVNYNGSHWIEACLESLLVQLAPFRHEIIVVDNASRDESMALVARRFPEVVRLYNQTNLGFARANNQAVAVARGDYLLLLNVDTRFLDGLEAMYQFLCIHEGCAAVGPRMVDGDGQLRASWGCFPTLGNLAATMLGLTHVPVLRRWMCPLLVRPGHRLYPSDARPVDWLSGACLLIPRRAWETIGALDEELFMYGEDTDWCYRAHQAGWQVWFLPDASLLHYGSGGREWRNWKGEAPTLQWARFVLYFYAKHRGNMAGTMARLLLAAGGLLRCLAGVILWCVVRPSERVKARQVITAYAGVLRLAATGRV
jgi:GT2 family glycosyltransferase